MSELICSVCGSPFFFDGILSSDSPMCDKCAEEEWQIIKSRGDLLEKIRWFFECTDAMITVHGLLVYSKEKQPKRYGAYRRLAIMTGEAESALRELTKI